MGRTAGVPLAGELVGRDSEQKALRALVEQSVAGSARWVVLAGEPGMGRTSLVRTVAAQSPDVLWLPVSGELSERRLPYAVLEQLARAAEPALPFRLPALTAPRSSAHEPATMGAALLDLLRTLAAKRPVGVVVDDLHLADEPSQHALLFAFRRLATSRVLALLSTTEDGWDGLEEGLRRFLETDAITIRLAGLGEREIRQLCVALGASRLSLNAAARLREHTGGNPRHLRALVDELGVGALNRWGATPIPAPKHVARAVLDQLSACPPPARRLVAAAAITDDRAPLSLVRRVAGLADALGALEDGVSAGLVDYQDRDIVFVSPLVRAAVYHGLPLGERAELHSRAATLVEDHGAALHHRAAAAPEPDEGLAAAIESFAAAEAARGAPASAAALFHEAARLVPAGARREGDVLAAAECLLVVGDAPAAAALSDGLAASADRSRSRYVLGRVAVLEGRYNDAEALFTRALDGADEALAAKIAVELARLCVCLLRPADAMRWAGWARDAVRGTALAQRPPPYLACGLAATRQLDEAVPVDACDPELALALLHNGAVEGARDQAAAAVRAASRSGGSHQHVTALAVLALAEYRLGAWTDAVMYAELAASIAEDEELASSQSLVHAAAAWPTAGRGEWAAAEAHVSRAVEAARCPWDLALARMAEAVLGRARGEHLRVVDAVTAFRGLGSPGAVDEPGGLWPWHEVYIGSLIALGLAEEATAELGCFETAASARGSAALLSIVCRLRGLLAMAQGMTEEADAAFCAALDVDPDAVGNFDRGLTHAAYGALLRRSGKRSASVTELKAARDVFAGLGARPFVERCDRDLASARRGREPRSGELTPREASVARLVSEGKRNREVATELVVSENTVEFHLKNIYAKLGIASRSQLIVELATRKNGHPL